MKENQIQELLMALNKLANKSKTFESLWNVDQSAEYLGTTISHIRKMIYHKEIPFFKVGKSVRFRKDELDQWMSERQS